MVRESVAKVLQVLGAGAKDSVLVFNKADLLPAERMAALKSGIVTSGTFFVSAILREGIDRLLDEIAARLGGSRIRREFFIPRERLGLAEFLYRGAEVLEREDRASGSRFVVKISLEAEKMFEAKLKNVCAPSHYQGRTPAEKRKLDR